ncbi:MAG: hypothetical protein ABJA76_08160 [Mucilaginibacter sp.]
MGAQDLTLVIFTCESREHLLVKTFQSFSAACGYKFQKVILAIDGQIDPSAITKINPDVILQYTKRRGYAHSISKALRLIDTPYFFWLEDDWTFHRGIDASHYTQTLAAHPDWAEMVFSKDGPLDAASKAKPLGESLYETSFGFSANPCFCNTGHLQQAFQLLERAPKGDKLGEDGFENFLSKTFEKQNIKCVMADPVDHLPISHEGYLESTPRNWHMTNSLEEKTNNHLMTIPVPSIGRRLLMVFKLVLAFGTLAIGQLGNNKIYEFCFRVIASAKTIKKDE